jgi:quinol monooxygenase YgiN
MTVLYCVSVDVDDTARADWLAWMRDVHVPDVLAEPGFRRARILRDASVESRFVVEYELDGRASLDGYLQGPAVARLRAEHEARYAGRARASRQILETVADLLPK